LSQQPSLWLRAETKLGEARAALVPDDAAKLIAQGFSITVETSSDRAFASDEYQQAGCQLAPAGSWVDAAPDTFILGLKELPEDGSSLGHRHIYFAHAFKEQQGWQQLLARFETGGGTLLDLEYLLDKNQRRVAAFGHWAGFVGAALAVLTWAGQQRGDSPALGSVLPWNSKDELAQSCARALQSVAQHSPRMIVIGALGRVGAGALALARAVQLQTTDWDLPQTAVGGPFAQLLEHEIFVNCVLVNSKLPPFIEPDMLAVQERKLRVIADVSCDPYGEYNPVPLYQRCSTAREPLIHLADQPPLDLIAIDNLPSLLPREASEDFSAQLLPALAKLGDNSDPVWAGALNHFQLHTNRMKQKS
jgi:saccharopine dehydrogenase (NAD+, L-lysine forming)